MNSFHRFVLAWPRTVLGLVCALWLGALPGLLRLEIATDGRALVPGDAPALRFDREIREQFGVGDELALVVDSALADGIWNPVTLRRVDELAHALAQEADVDAASIQSLATDRGDQVFPGTLTARAWLDPMPATADEVAHLRQRLERVDLYRGTLLPRADPARSTAIVFRLAPLVDRRLACARLQRWVEERRDSAHALCLVGAPVFESRLGDHLLDDLARLVPAAFAVLALVLFLAFRSAWAVLLPLAGVGFALSTTLALMGWCGARVYLTILVLPVVLTVVGVASAIHVQGDYFAALAARPSAPPIELLRGTLARLWKSVASAEITTALGFVSFAFSPLRPVAVFGLFATLGVALYLLWTLIALPAALACLGARVMPAAARERSSRVRDGLARVCRRSAGIALRQRWAVVVFTLILAAACVHGVQRMRVQDSWLEGFARSSDTYRDAKRVDEEFSGTHILRIRVDSEAMAARGVLTRASVDGVSVLLPGIPPIASSALALQRLRLIPLSAQGSDLLARPLDLVVTGIEPRADARSRVFVRHPVFESASIVDLLPQGIDEFTYELSAEDRLCEPAMFDLVTRLESFLEMQSDLGVGRVLGPHAHLATLNAILGGSAERLPGRLSTREGILESLELYERGRGAALLHEVWSVKRDRALITILVRGASFVPVGELLARIRDFERRELTPHGLALAFGGDLALSQALIGGIVTTQVGSILLSVAALAIVVALMTRSLRVGLACAVPCALAILFDFALMGWGGVPLGVATSMFAAMALGVGIDWAIHLVRAVRRHAELGVEAERAIEDAFAEVGPAVLVDALAVALGFSVMLLSSVPPSVHLGLLLVTSFVVCSVATVLVLPALLAPIRRGPSPAREPN